MLYEFKCECGETFDEMMSVKEYETFEAKCPECGSKKVRRTIANIPVKFNFFTVGKNYKK